MVQVVVNGMEKCQAEKGLPKRFIFLLGVWVMSYVCGELSDILLNDSPKEQI